MQRTDFARRIAALSLWADAVQARAGVKSAIANAQEIIAARKARP